MIKLTFTNIKGKSIEIGRKPPFILQKITGLGDVDASLQTQKAPHQDGTTHTGTNLEERPISIELIILNDEISTRRQELSAIFNPKLGEGILRIEIGEEVKEIGAVSEHVPKFPGGKDGRNRNYQSVLIDLLCPNPFWLETEQTEQLVVWEGGLEFPLQLPTIFAELSSSKSKLLYNGGDEETPIQIVFNGPATAPIRISNLTIDKYIEVDQNLVVGERLEISTAFGQKKVTKFLADGSKTNAFHYISLGSEFFGLEVGNNLIDYSTGADYEQAAVAISWKERFLAV